MKACPKCGKVYAAGAAICTECHEGLTDVPDVKQSIPSTNSRIHWLWAFLIIVALRVLSNFAIDAIVTGYIDSMPMNQIHASIQEIINLEYTAKLLLFYATIVVWVKLTHKRYSHSRVWIMFNYLWLIASPLYPIGEYGYSLISIGYQAGYIIMISLISSVAGPLLFACYKRRLQRKLTA